MDTLHKSLREQLTALPMTLLIELIEQKLKEHDVALTERQRRAVRRVLEAKDWSNLVLPLGNHRDKELTIRVEHADIEGIQLKAQRVLDALPEMMHSLSEELATITRKDLDARWAAEDRRRQREARQFERRLRGRWDKPMSGLRQLVVMATELGESVNHRLRKEQLGQRPYTIEVQTRLHARACQIANEVVTLLGGGFAEGAIARWRSLHEVAVVSMFIRDSERLAERYRLHEVVESLRIARLYCQHQERLGLEPLPEDEIPKLETTVLVLRQRFGDSYGQQYGWAADKLGKAKPTFEQIEAAAEVGHLRPYYKLASHSVHANPKGAFFRLGLIDQTELLLAGPSNYGLADAGQNTALSLVHATVSLALLDPTLDSITILRILLAMSGDIAEEFVEVQQAIETDGASRQPEHTEPATTSDGTGEVLAP